MRNLRLPRGGGRGRSLATRLGLAAVIAVIALVAYFSQSSVNPVTGKTQHVAMSFDQEGVMRVLAEAGGAGGQPESFSTHPNPENRIGRIEQAIERRVPGGVPDGLIP